MKIKSTNTEKLNQELTKIQTRCSVRILTAEDIQETIVHIEKRLLHLGIAKKYWKGAAFKYENGYKMPASYKGRPEATKFALIRGASAWFITGLARGDCNHDRQITFVNETEYKQHYNF